MPLVLCRHRDVRPGSHFQDNQYLVLNAEGYKVGSIQLEEHMTDPDARWGWYINGEIVAGQVSPSGHVATRDEAKAELAKQWRRWLELNGLAETHQPVYG